MRFRALLSTRSPVWRVGGVLLFLGTFAATAVYMARGPRPLQPESGDGLLGGKGTQGRFGTFVEQLGEGKFALSYETIRGTAEAIHLEKVSGRLEEPETTWGMVSPQALRSRGIWTLNGPMDVQAWAARSTELLGKGNMHEPGPALAWDHGVWTGLSTLVWDDLQGNGRGRWTLPPGWHRGLDGLFRVDKGPVHWEAAEPGALRNLTAERMQAALGFREGRMEDVLAQLEGGSFRAGTVLIGLTEVIFQAPIAFWRADGWTGSAGHGVAPRPPAGKPFDQVDFQDFRAARPVPGGNETVQSLGARWTPAGLRMEGDVQLEQPMDGMKAVLRAPRILQRTAPGPDLPAGLQAGETWAEPQALLTWGGARSLSSPQIQAWHLQRTWRILAPALGRGEMGTFSAGEGMGNPLRWEFKGPIQAQFFDGAQVRSDALVWENAQMTLTGRPATWSRTRQRLTGATLVRSQDEVRFPDGIAGALGAPEGDILLRAERGQAKDRLIDLDGRVECQGQAGRLQADHISVTLGPGNVVKLMTATGAVILRGRMGEGRGDALDLDPVHQTANWHGGVKALSEVRP